MVNCITASITNGTRVVIAFTDHAFKSRVEGWRVWFERFSALPCVMLFSNLERVQAVLRAKLSPCATKRLDVKRLFAVWTDLTNPSPSRVVLSVFIFAIASAGTKFPHRRTWNQKLPTTIGAILRLAFCSPFVGALLRAVFTPKERAKKRLAAVPTGDSFSTSLINGVTLPYHVLRSPNTVTLIGTTKAFQKVARFYVKRFVANWTCLVHSITLKRCLPSASPLSLSRCAG
jgi:hypothetical protein